MIRLGARGKRESEITEEKKGKPTPTQRTVKIKRPKLSKKANAKQKKKRTQHPTPKAENSHNESTNSATS